MTSTHSGVSAFKASNDCGDSSKAASSSSSGGIPITRSARARCGIPRRANEWRALRQSRFQMIDLRLQFLKLAIEHPFVGVVVDMLDALSNRAGFHFHALNRRDDVCFRVVY